MFAVGGNDEVARLSGVRTGRTVLTAHVLCSVMAGVAGLLIAARFGTGSAAGLHAAATTSTRSPPWCWAARC